MTAITIIALVGSVVGAYVIANHHREGYYVWAVANILWCADAIQRQDFVQTMLWGYYLWTCYLGLENWRK